MKDTCYTKLCEQLHSSNIKMQEPMSKHTTFRVGGNADFYVSVASANDLQAGISICQKMNIPYVVLGNGSNVLVSDAGIRGVVFQLDTSFSGIEVKVTADNIMVYAQAGAMLSAVGSQCLKHELTGFEWAAGIPGTVGGGVYMNAGAYGGEMKDILKEVTVLEQDGTFSVRDCNSLDLSYRHSCLMQEKAYVLDATFELQKGDAKAIKARMDELALQRRTKQPLEFPSAGSTFKRPEGYFAGKLIQDAGLRGFTVGGAQVSEKHCGFVINKDHATADDIYQLTKQVDAIVFEKFGVHLEREIRLIGEFE